LSPLACCLATLPGTVLWRLVSGLLQIDSALMLIGLAGRDDSDCFFAIWIPLKVYVHHQQHSFANLADRLPALLAIDHPIFSKYQIWIRKDPRCRLEIHARVLLLV